MNHPMSMSTRRSSGGALRAANRFGALSWPTVAVTVAFSVVWKLQRAEAFISPHSTNEQHLRRRSFGRPIPRPGVASHRWQGTTAGGGIPRRDECETPTPARSSGSFGNEKKGGIGTPATGNASRREFLSGGATSAMSGIVGGMSLSPNDAMAAGSEPAGTMLSRVVPLSTRAPLQLLEGGNGAVTLPPIGLGAWSWGDTLFWGYDPSKDDELRQVFDYAVDEHLAFFDTAELYGLGRSETLLGQFSEGRNDQVSIATKFAALPWRTKAKDVLEACRNSVQRLSGGKRPIDLYQIHFPNAWSNAEYWDGLAMAYEEGLVRSVGVSNYGVDATRAAHAALKERGIQLATNQIQLSLLYRWPVDNGLLETCAELGVKVLSYSPLALGLLTGKYTKDRLPNGPRKGLAEKLFEDENQAYSNLLDTMKTVASNHGEEATLSQVAINWARAKGTTPIPGARTLRQARQNIGAVKWSLSGEEVRMLDEASANVPPLLPPDKAPFPKKDVNTGLVMFDS